MSMHRRQKRGFGMVITLVVAVLLTSPVRLSAQTPSPDIRKAIDWYDTLSFPDVTNLPYVRVATGEWSQEGNDAPMNSYVEGFLVRGESDAFTVFICSISNFNMDDPSDLDEPYPALSTVRFVRETDGPDYEHVDYEVLAFATVAYRALDRVRDRLKPGGGGLRSGNLVTHQARIFAFARAALQKGLPDIAMELMNIAAAIPDPQTGKTRDTATFRDALQRQIGDAVLSKAESDFGEDVSWEELLKQYESFERRFPASQQLAYARESSALLRAMISGRAEHHPKPENQMSANEVTAEKIYQFRNLGSSYFDLWGADKNKAPYSPLDFDFDAIPQLIEAIGDRTFTRSMSSSFHISGSRGAAPEVMRVSDIAEEVLGKISGLDVFSTKQQAEAWWESVQRTSESQVLSAATAQGSQSGVRAARKLVEKYPDSAIAAIEAGMRATKEDGYRSEYIDEAGRLPGNLPVPFLRSKLAPAPDNGLYSQISAASALFTHGQSEAVPAMIEAWKQLKSEMANDGIEHYDEIGRLISFLAKSGSVEAIDALGNGIREDTVDVRLAVVRAFLPWPKQAGESSNGPGIGADGDIPTLPGGTAGASIERLLIAALEDTGPRINMKGNFDEASYENPRVCDFAALVLSKRWPEKYPFEWSEETASRDLQITMLKQKVK